MSGLNALAELSTHGTLVSNHVGPSAAETCRSHGLMGVYHNMMLGGLHDSIMVMVVDGLAVVAFAEGDDGAHIAALHGVVAV